MKIKRIAILLVMFMGISGCTQKPVENPTKRELAIAMMHVAGFERTIQASGPSLTDAWKRSRPDVPKEFWEENMKDLELEYANKLLDAHIDTIVDTYSERDLQDILDFYETPIGKKLASMSGQILPKIQAQFAIDFARIEVSVQDRLKSRGY